MIRKLKIRLILLSMICLTILLSLLVTGMNLINYTALTRESDEILTLMSETHGRLPSLDLPNKLPEHLSPEIPYETRYFSVLLNGIGNPIYVETGRIAAVNTKTALQYAKAAMERNGDNGFLDHFRYCRVQEEDRTLLIFLDCGRKLDTAKSFLITSISIALCGLVTVFFVILFFAERIVRPIAESYEKQKRFITDAGHEIKTPLTVIGANTELLEMDLGEHESLTEIRNQTKRLGDLTRDLVALARMEESDHRLSVIDFPISEVVAEAMLPFATIAKAREIRFSQGIEPLLTARGDSKSITQLVSILMDNVIKYTPAGGIAELSLSKQSRGICLSVCNTVAEPMDEADLPHLFERFYRTDRSRNSETGGYGIGLSLAEAIVVAHGGRIRADCPDEHRFRILITLPT